MSMGGGIIELLFLMFGPVWLVILFMLAYSLIMLILYIPRMILDTTRKLFSSIKKIQIKRKTVSAINAISKKRKKRNGKKSKSLDMIRKMNDEGLITNCQLYKLVGMKPKYQRDFIKTYNEYYFQYKFLIK